MVTGGFNFQGAHNYLATQNEEAVKARADNATFNNPDFPELHDRRCMAVSLGHTKYNIEEFQLVGT